MAADLPVYQPLHIYWQKTSQHGEPLAGPVVISRNDSVLSAIVWTIFPPGAAVFIRFVATPAIDNPWGACGVISAAFDVRDAGDLPREYATQLSDVLDWFSDHLPIPPFKDRCRRGLWSRRAVCWFHSEAGEPIAKAWELVRLLKLHGTRVRLLRTVHPGHIVYRDAYQIVAESPRRARRGLVCARL